MTEEPPIEKAFHLLDEILKLLDEKRYANVNSKDYLMAEKQMDVLEKQVAQLVKETDEKLKSLGFSDQDLRRFTEEIPEKITSEGRETLTKAQKLKQKLETIFQGYALLRGEQTAPVVKPKPLSKKEEEAQARKRKKKFKGMGSGDKWKPV